MGIIFPCQPLLRRVWLEISICYRAWRLNFYVWGVSMHDTTPKTTIYGMPCAFWGSRMVTWPSWQIAPFSHSGQNFQTVKIWNPWWSVSPLKYIEIYLREKGKRMLDWSLKQSLLWAQRCFWGILRCPWSVSEMSLKCLWGVKLVYAVYCIHVCCHVWCMMLNCQ